MTTAETRRYTPDDLLAMEDGGHYELVDGRLVERCVSTDSSEVALLIAAEMVAFCRANRVGRLYDAELGVRAFPGAPGMVRRADVAYIRADRAPARPTGFLEVMPDLVVEVVSLGDNARDVRGKVETWLGGGVTMVWVVYPNVREITVYRVGQRPRVLGPDDEIDGEDVMPGFRCQVARFFPEPEATPPPGQP